MKMKKNLFTQTLILISRRQKKNTRRGKVKVNPYHPKDEKRKVAVNLPNHMIDIIRKETKRKTKRRKSHKRKRVKETQRKNTKKTKKNLGNDLDQILQNIRTKIRKKQKVKVLNIEILI